MIRYHGTPITPTVVAATTLRSKHGLVSFFHKLQMELVAEVCQSFILDNGAFSAWKLKSKVDWEKYVAWVKLYMYHPGFDWCLIPDIIDGDEYSNRKLIEEWTLPKRISVPIWHLHESFDYLKWLISSFKRVAIGSSGEYSSIRSKKWYERMDAAFDIICRSDGYPKVKVHGLRMLNPSIAMRYPFASVDSSSVARAINIDSKWHGVPNGLTMSKSVRGAIMVDRFETLPTASRFNRGNG